MTDSQPLEITVPLRAATNLKFCEDVVRQINRDPNRRAEVKRDELICQVIDYSRPIKATGHGSSNIAAQDVIIGWEPMEREINSRNRRLK